MRIDAFDPETAGPAELDGWHGLRVAADRFDLPDDPAPPRSATVGGLLGGEEQRVTWLARPDRDRAGILGGATLSLESFENAHYAEVDVWVRPDTRRSGIGRALFDRARQAAVHDGRTELELSLRADGPGSAFAAALGARPALEETRRLLRVRDTEPAAVAGWAAGAGSRTDKFELVRWTDHCPEDLLEPFARARDGMNDAPVGEMDWHPVRLTAERIRVRAAASVRRGHRRHLVAVRALATGALAGLSTVFVSPDSVRANQGDTTVLPPYRGAVSACGSSPTCSAGCPRPNHTSASTRRSTRRGTAT